MDSILQELSTGDSSAQFAALRNFLESSRSGKLALNYSRLFQELSNIISGKESTHAEVAL